MECEITLTAETLTASLDGEIDHHTAKGLREKIDFEIENSSPKTLILDFSDVTFMDSSGIGLIMGRYKLMNELDGEIIVACPPSYIRKVLQISGIHRLAKIVPDYSAILKAYNADCKDYSEDHSKEAEKVETKNN